MDEVAGAVYRYEIDAADRITEVSDAWLEFARENDAPDLTREAVVGRRLWDFVTGDEARQLHRAVLRRVRNDDVQIILPFRCDSPACRRWMRLVMTPRSAGAVRLDGVLERRHTRPALRILDAHARRTSDELAICSCCRRVAVASEWLEPEDAIVRLHELGAEPYPSLKNVVCDACRGLASNPTGREISGANGR